MNANESRGDFMECVGTGTNYEEKILVSAREAAGLLGISRTTWLSLYNSGKTPKAIRLGRRILWRLEELKDWVDEGCPSRYNWKWKGAVA